MLLEDDGRRQRGLEAMRGVPLDDPAEAAEGFAFFLVVVRQGVQPALNGERRTEAIDNSPLGRGEGEPRRRRRVSAREREPL